jgi:hypothetical protein
MLFNVAKTIASASAGLMLGALTGCGGGNPPAETPETPPSTATEASKAAPAKQSAQEAKACCKGMHECKGKGGCAVEGKHDCAGHNDCKGQGGCNHHCPM